jgi:hypothetical protein
VEFCSPAGVKLNINPFPLAHRWITEAKINPWHDSTIAIFESWLTFDNDSSIANVSRLKYLKYQSIFSTKKHFISNISTWFFVDHEYMLDIINVCLVSMHDRFEYIYEERFEKKQRILLERNITFSFFYSNIFVENKLFSFRMSHFSIPIEK